MAQNAAPMVDLQGIQDLSIRREPVIPEALPQHLPWIHILAERGDDVPRLVAGADATRIYGAKSFDQRGKFANPATVLASTVMGEANTVMLQRIIPAGARKATARLYCEVSEVPQLPVYERNSDGSFLRDEMGQKIPVAETTVAGHRVSWYTVALESNEEIGQGSTILNSDPADPSAPVVKAYPIMDLPAGSFGFYGNNLGIRFSAPTVKSPIPVDEDLVVDQEAQLYRIQFVERPDEKSSPIVQPTVSGAPYVEFMFKQGAVNPSVERDIHFNDIVVPSYSDDGKSSGTAPIFHPMEGLHLYEDNFNEILLKLYLAEKAEDEGMITPDMMNPLTAVHYDGVPYKTVEVAGPSDGGLLMTENSTIYLTGGDDGDLSWTEFEKAVGTECANFEISKHHLMDDAIYPMSIVYDVGYSMPIKKQLFVPMGLRKDISTTVSTQDITRPYNTADEENSAAVALRAAARIYPESVIYGTPCCRAVIVGHAGTGVNIPYKGMLPMTIDLAQKRARYMGASNGKFKPRTGYDISPTNHVTMLTNVNVPYKPAKVRNKDWDAGLVWVQSFDRRSLFYPGIQTVYSEDTSVLNSDINMLIMTECEKVCARVWRELTGRSDLTNAQFIERSDLLIEQKTNGRFNDRVVIVPETFMTEDDETRGYSWSCRIHVYANNMKTVGTFTVVARRREELE